MTPFPAAEASMGGEQRPLGTGQGGLFLFLTSVAVLLFLSGLGSGWGTVPSWLSLYFLSFEFGGSPISSSQYVGKMRWHLAAAFCVILYTNATSFFLAEFQNVSSEFIPGDWGDHQRC